MAINAIRLCTADPADQQGRYRYLQAVSGGGWFSAVPVASPAQWETFLFDPPTVWPLASGAQLSMNLCDSNWDPSGMLVHVDHGVHVFPRPSKKEPPLVTYAIGGPGQRVWVSAGFSAGYPAYPGDDPRERIFDIVKPGGGQINSGDSVSLQINANLGRTFFFRVAGEQDIADIFGDGTAPGQADTTFIVEFVEVQSGLGVCGAVVGAVTRAAGGQPIPNAQVEALNAIGNRPFTGVTDSNGTYTLTNPAAGTCVPAGIVKVRASANRFQTKTVDPVVVPGGGTANVPIQLDCTQVTVKVVDNANLAIPGVPVMLLDTSGTLLLDLNGQPYIANTGLDGGVTFNCVQHGTARVQTTADPTTQPQFNVPPAGASVTIVVQSTCGNLVGKVVTDLVTRTGIPNATVTIVGTTLQMITAANGDFRFICVRPAGSRTVHRNRASVWI